MAVKHSKVSAKADGGDATLVLPSDWNASHTIDPATVTLAMQADLAQSTIVGRAAGAGTGVPTALTPAQAKAVLALVPADVTGLAAIASSGSASDLTAGSIPAARIAAATITLAMLANISATQRLIGRNSAGAGVPEEVTASQLFDWVSSTNGVLLTRTAGTWGALANVTTDNGDLVIADNATPVAPSAGSKLFSRSLAGRSLPSVLGATNRSSALQPHLGQAHAGFWHASANNAVSVFGGATLALVGTGTTRVAATTNLCTSLRRVGIVSAAGAGSIAALNPNSFWAWRGNAAGLGGFHAVFRFAISDAALVATANMFVGIRDNTFTDVAPSTLTNLVGIGVNNGDTVLQLYAAGAVAQARVSLGANFPANNPNVDVYELILFADPNGSTIKYRVERLNTGDVASGTISAGASLPSNTTMMGPEMARSNGGTATAVGIDFISAYFETDF